MENTSFVSHMLVAMDMTMMVSNEALVVPIIDES